MYSPIGLCEEMRRFAENIDAKRNTGGTAPSASQDFSAGTKAVSAQDNTINTVNSGNSAYSAPPKF